MKIKLLCSLILVCTSFFASSQSPNDNIFQSLSYHFGLGIMPAFETEFNAGPDQFLSYDIGYDYRFRYNIYNISDDQSVSIDAMPGIGFDYGQFQNGDSGGLLGLELPIMVAFNTGAAATYDTSKDFGLGLALGLDLHYMPMIAIDGIPEGAKKLYALPCVQLNIRYWGKNSNKLREVFLRYAFAKNDSKFDDNEDLIRPIVISGGIGYYFNY